MASKDSNSTVSAGGGSSIVTELNVSMMIVVALIAVAAVMLGCVHLTARCCADRRRRRNGGGDIESVATMSSMRSLFHHMQQQHHHHLLHYYHHNGGGGGGGIEQALIDALPVFPYVCLQGSSGYYGCGYGGKVVVEDCDCAVCLCEFLPDDRLRLLPQCLHAFHADCIGTWLLSHSTCPLCRRDLLTEPWHAAAAHAVFGISGHLYTDSIEDSTDLNNSSPDNSNATNSIITFSAPSLPMVDSNSSHRMMSPQSTHINPPFTPSCSDRIVLPVHLGRFRISGSSTSCAEISCASKSHRLASSISSQRSYSLGSLEYVLTPKDLQVVIRPATPSECIPTTTKTSDDAAERCISRGCVSVRTSNNELILLDHMKERLLGKDGSKFSPTHPQMPPPSRSRAFSFRLPKPDRRWKVDQSKRRSLSETAGLEHVLHSTNPLDSATAATATTSADSSNADNSNNARVTSSFRKWALVWIRS